MTRREVLVRSTDGSIVQRCPLSNQKPLSPAGYMNYDSPAEAIVKAVHGSDIEM